MKLQSLGIILAAGLCLYYQMILAAVGCSLNDPDRDIKRIFPQSTGYKTDFISIEERGGLELKNEIEDKLKDKLNDSFESLDVPYAYYTVLKGKEIIGYMHGVNQKGMYGGMQLILATDLNGIIVKFYYQRLSSPEAKQFRAEPFLDSFNGLSLADFYRHDANAGGEGVEDKIAQIEDPSDKSHLDFEATLRGIKKNLILHDEFILKNKYDQVYQSEMIGNNEQ